MAPLYDAVTTRVFPNLKHDRMAPQDQWQGRQFAACGFSRAGSDRRAEGKRG